MFSRTAAGAKGEFQAHLAGRFLLPRFAAVGLATQHALPDRQQFCHRLRPVHMGQPVAAQFDRAVGEQSLLLRGAGLVKCRPLRSGH